MQTIYRFENKHGIGIYMSGIASKLNDFFRTKKGEIPSHQPEPDNDGLGEHDDYADMDKYYGFKTLDQLYRWIGNCPLEIIYEHGCKIVKVDVTDCEFGKSQVRFRRRDVIAKHVYETPEQFSREV